MDKQEGGADDLAREKDKTLQAGQFASHLIMSCHFIGRLVLSDKDLMPDAKLYQQMQPDSFSC